MRQVRRRHSRQGNAHGQLILWAMAQQEPRKSRRKPKRKAQPNLFAAIGPRDLLRALAVEQRSLESMHTLTLSGLQKLQVRLRCLFAHLASN